MPRLRAAWRTQAPYLIAGGRWDYRMGDGALYDSVLRDGLNDAFSDAHSGWHTEDLVEKYEVTREAQDLWALRSQQRFAAAQPDGRFKLQIVPVDVAGKKGPTQFDKDEHNRPDTTLETLARLKPAFRPNGTITAGNAPGLNDAACAMVLADGAWAEKRGLAPTARLVSYGIAAVEPGMFGLGPVPAVRQALQRAGWDIRTIERTEINEAFAAIAKPSSKPCLHATRSSVLTWMILIPAAIAFRKSSSSVPDPPCRVSGTRATLDLGDSLDIQPLPRLSLHHAL
jgi:acetyl-CoA C-acetyltransferase